MNVIEAYELTLDKLEELKAKGFEVKMVQPKVAHNKETVEKYNRPDRLPPDMWLHVSIGIKSEKDQNDIFELKKYLAMAGISFDTGGWQGYRDWELDWSFTCKSGCNDKEIETSEMLEDLIKSVGENNRDDEKQ